MEARFGGEAHYLYGMGSVDLRAVGKRALEWDLNDYKWDGDLFIATPLNPVPSDILNRQFLPIGSAIPVTGGSSNCSSSSSDDVNLGTEKGKRELEKRRRITLVEYGDLSDDPGNLSLNLGGNGYQITEREVTSGKKTKFAGGNLNRGVCQVQDCGADLSNAKDYHRRHKVCEMHSKAGRALVGNVMQRFCQQCSRFHVLQEFDEGRRSCRRRLAGHNQRRRKTNPDTVVNTSSSNDEQTSGYLLITLLKILSNIHANGSNHTTDQDLLSHLLKSLASQTSENGGKNLSGLLQEPQNFLSNKNISAFLSDGLQAHPRPSKLDHTIPLSENLKQNVQADNARGGDTQMTSSAKPSILNGPPGYSEVRDSPLVRSKMNNFDLNDIYVDSDIEDVERSSPPTNMGTSSVECPSWVQQDSHQSSPPQTTSGNSESVFVQSPSSSSGEAQSRTDRIVFKLFGKEPNDFPLVLRAQIFDWLAHSQTDIESYIRPGCVVLTIYLRQTQDAWDELCYDLSSSLNRLLQTPDNAFWGTGWVYVRVRQQIAFINNGQVVIEASLPLRSDNYCRIISVKPIAVSASEEARFSVRGSNLNRPSTRLLCALEGNYITQKAINQSDDSIDSSKEQDDIQCVSFSCSVPVVNGRGFIEVEDHGFSSSFIPFIVAEEDICAEIRVLESAFEVTEMSSDSEGATNVEARSQAMDFIHEMGWLLHRNQLKSRLAHLDPNTDPFPLDRFKWLMEFSMDHDWCAVVKKLLDILLDGTGGSGDFDSSNFALLEMGLLHRAVRRGSRPLVELLLRYSRKKVIDLLGAEGSVLVDGGKDGFLFRPDAKGPAGLTPLHIAAGKDGSEDVLDALTDDPAMVGIEAWKNARDSTGSTPEDYARLRGHYSYIHLVQKKINKRSATGHVVVDIPNIPSDPSTNQKQNNELTTSFEIGRTKATRIQRSCRLCDHPKLVYGTGNRSLVYKPAMLSMVAIAAVCVCVALLFKSSPEVLFVFRPFRWELLDYGTS